MNWRLLIGVKCCCLSDEGVWNGYEWFVECLFCQLRAEDVRFDHAKYGDGRVSVGLDW